MKKISISLSSMLLCLFLSLPINAQAQNAYINNGYTSDGIYYVVYEIETVTSNERAVGDTINVVREFHFTGIIQPSSQRTYTETINGITYTGTLKLYSFIFEKGNTIAAYKGTLTAIN